MNTYAPWQRAARRMVGEACLAAYLTANPKGRKRHRPYVVPDWVHPLLDAVERDDEVETKRLMHVIRMGCFTLV
jgi:hypothetical protein